MKSRKKLNKQDTKEITNMIYNTGMFAAYPKQKKLKNAEAEQLAKQFAKRVWKPVKQLMLNEEWLRAVVEMSEADEDVIARAATLLTKKAVKDSPKMVELMMKIQDDVEDELCGECDEECFYRKAHGIEEDPYGGDDISFKDFINRRKDGDNSDRS